MRKVYVRGLGYLGQIGNKETISTSEHFVQVRGLIGLNIDKIRASYFGTLCTTHDMHENRLYYWGWQLDSMSGYRTLDYYLSVPILSTIITKSRKLWNKYYIPNCLSNFDKKLSKLELNNSFIAVLQEDNLAWGIGRNLHGQFGKKISTTDIPILLGENIKTIKDIAVGYTHLLLLDDQGNTHGIGGNLRSQMGPGGEISFLPKSKRLGYVRSYIDLKDLHLPEQITEISAGKYHSSFLSISGTPYMLGSYKYRDYEKTNSTENYNPQLLEIPGSEKIIQISSGDHHILMLSDKGEVYGVGATGLGQILGMHEKIDDYRFTPEKIPLPNKSPVIRIKARNSRSLAFCSNGDIFYWGGHTYYQKNVRENLVDFQNLLSEDSIKMMNEKIIDFDCGMCHDVLLTESSQTSEVDQIDNFESNSE